MLMIRRAGIADLGALGEILSCSWKIAYKGIVPDEVLERLTPESRTAIFIPMFTEGRADISLGMEDGQAAGFVITGKCRDADMDTCGEIWSIYLKPEFWRRGIGSALFSHGMDELKKQGYSKIALWVIEGNYNAIAFYEKHGFKPDGARKAIDIGKTLWEKRYVKEGD